VSKTPDARSLFFTLGAGRFRRSADDGYADAGAVRRHWEMLVGNTSRIGTACRGGGLMDARHP
jgi:hypothetical protein